MRRRFKHMSRCWVKQDHLCPKQWSGMESGWATIEQSGQQGTLMSVAESGGVMRMSNQSWETAVL